jgi:hypothetical protein
MSVQLTQRTYAAIGNVRIIVPVADGRDPPATAFFERPPICNDAHGPSSSMKRSLSRSSRRKRRQCD